MGMLENLMEKQMENSLQAGGLYGYRSQFANAYLYGSRASKPWKYSKGLL